MVLIDGFAVVCSFSVFYRSFVILLLKRLVKVSSLFGLWALCFRHKCYFCIIEGNSTLPRLYSQYSTVILSIVCNKNRRLTVFSCFCTFWSKKISLHYIRTKQLMLHVCGASTRKQRSYLSKCRSICSSATGYGCYGHS